MKRLLTATAFLMGTTGIAAAEGELQLFNWGNYTSPELLAKFEKDTGIKVTVTDYDSNDTALAKVEAGGSGFDLVVPSANYVQIWVEKGLVDALDLSKLPNHGNIAPEWMDVPWDTGRTHTGIRVVLTGRGLGQVAFRRGLVITRRQVIVATLFVRARRANDRVVISRFDRRFRTLVVIIARPPFIVGRDDPLTAGGGFFILIF